jgi:hypothetical protein
MYSILFVFQKKKKAILMYNFVGMAARLNYWMKYITVFTQSVDPVGHYEVSPSTLALRSLPPPPPLPSPPLFNPNYEIELRIQKRSSVAM